MNKDDTICSHTSVERYLLNKMTTDEETEFQKHLFICSKCSEQLNVIRDLSVFISDELPVSAGKNVQKKAASILSLSTNMRWIMLAACLLPLFGIILHKSLHQSGTPHDTHMMHQNKASVEYADTSWELLSPSIPLCTVNPNEDEIVFRWNREGAFHLQLEADGKTVAEIDSTGTDCTIDPFLAVHYKYLDWTLTIEGKELKGRLFIQTKQE